MNKSSKKQLYGHLPPITQIIQIRRTRHTGYYWRSKDELTSDVFLWTHTHGPTSGGQPIKIYINQLREDS